MFSLDSTVTPDEARQYSPVVLAFIGDAVYSLYVREKLCFSTDYKTGELQKLTSKTVSARGQSELVEKLFPLFTQEETEIFKRGRNAKKPTKSKNATVAEYNRSTGFEAVIGYLYITGNKRRIDELLKNVTDGEYQ